MPPADRTEKPITTVMAKADARIGMGTPRCGRLPRSVGRFAGELLAERPLQNRLDAQYGQSQGAVSCGVCWTVVVYFRQHQFTLCNVVDVKPRTDWMNSGTR
jgi:hypothetical protein